MNQPMQGQGPQIVVRQLPNGQTVQVCSECGHGPLTPVTYERSLLDDKIYRVKACPNCGVIFEQQPIDKFTGVG